MISILLLGLAALFFGWNALYALLWHKKIAVSFSFLQQFVYAGEQTQMTERVENGKRFPIPVLEVAFQVDRGLSFPGDKNVSVSDFTYKRDVFALLGRQRITRTLTVDCQKRGVYQIDRASLTAFSLLQERRFSTELPADASLYVYAARADVSDIMTVCERLMGNLQCAKRLYEDPFAFAAIREYTPTDPIKSINWKASAKTGNLMVNAYESTRTERLWIFLDLEDRGILKQEALIEASISIAASLSQKMIGQGMEVGLCANVAAEQKTPEDPAFLLLKSGEGKEQLSRIEKALAGCKASDKTLPFSCLLAKTADRKKNLWQEENMFLFLSKNTRENETAILDFVGKTRQALWVFPCQKGEEWAASLSPNLRLVRREVEGC